MTAGTVEGDVPGQGHLGPKIDEFDERVDAFLERYRGHPVADTVFTAASGIADFSLVWHLLSVARGVARRRPDQIVLLAVMIGVESLLVNQGVKRLFNRRRPTTTGDARLPVRRPSTSSFPSGHASSAAFAATMLSGWDRRSMGGLWWAVAAVVGTSRAYVRIHHASDVIAGAVVGVSFGLIGRRIARRILPD
ncbi:MAG: phosphatase PAP2 family protein [Ilumatobacteraceae bacterium]